MDGPEAPDDEPGGDAVCWLERVCEACGALSDGPPPPVCERCGARAGTGPEAPPC